MNVYQNLKHGYTVNVLDKIPGLGVFERPSFEQRTPTGRHQSPSGEELVIRCPTHGPAIRYHN